MKIISTIIIFLFVSIQSYSQVPNWLFATGNGGIATDVGRGVCADAAGNMYVVGTFQSPSITIGTTTFFNKGNADIFIAKYDINGNVLWAKTAGGRVYDYSKSIEVDNNGNVYVAGYFGDSLTFDSYVLTTPTMNIGGFLIATTSMFVAKFDSSGNTQWVKNNVQVSNHNVTGNDLDIDANGNVYVSGVFSNTVTFGSLNLSTGNNYVLKYDTNGNEQFATSYSGPGLVGGGISLDGSNNIYITGTFSSQTMFSNTDTLFNVGGDDIYVLKLDNTGQTIWLKSISGTGDDEIYNLKADVQGNVCITGWSDSPTLTIGNTTFTNSGSYKMITAQFDRNGNVSWATQAPISSLGYGVASDNAGHFYTTGSYGGTISFGNFNLTTAGASDIYVTKYDTIGNVLWAKSAGGFSSDEGYNISFGADSNIYVTGTYFDTSATFDNFTIPNVGGFDYFLAKLENSTTGIAEIINEFPFDVNPTLSSNGHFTINLSSTTSNNTSMSIYTSNGKLILSKNVYSKNFEIDLENLPSANYFIAITNGISRTVKPISIIKDN